MHSWVEVRKVFNFEQPFFKSLTVFSADSENIKTPALISAVLRLISLDFLWINAVQRWVKMS